MQENESEGNARQEMILMLETKYLNLVLGTSTYAGGLKLSSGDNRRKRWGTPGLGSNVVWRRSVRQLEMLGSAGKQVTYS
jgi:hypothetical protein